MRAILIFFSIEMVFDLARVQSTVRVWDQLAYLLSTGHGDRELLPVAVPGRPRERLRGQGFGGETSPGRPEIGPWRGFQSNRRVR